ncbi:MAG TPA: murein biosynthesis integral membrane protein MurJ [Herpetosiphonaceae bacterium]|nr:murein biosynthesis integral membrane protein MurJ [Herpetosiphonaceae bacterium]
MSNESTAPAPATTPPPTTPATRPWGVLLNSVIVMIGFVLSRLLGLVRDSIFANYFGTSAVSDAYRVAFQLPDLLYLVIIGGALGSAFIPIFSEAYTKDNHERAWQITRSVVNIALVALVAVSAIIALLADPLIGAFYPAYTPEHHALTVYLTRLFLLSPLLLGLGGLAMATLNALDRFTLPALAPAIYNLSIIGGIVGLAPLMGANGWARYEAGIAVQDNGRAFSIEGVAWGVVIGAGLYLLLQLPGVWRAGFRYRLQFGWRDSAVRRIGKLMAPRVFGQAAMQINIIVMAIIASPLGDGRVTALNNGYQLMLLPHGIFALSLGTVMFPKLSRLYAAADMAEFGATMRSTLRNVLWTVLPAAVGLALLSVPMVRLLFQRGEFDSESTALVSRALILYATALPAFAVSEILIRAFYAMQDTKTPVLAGLLTIGINIALAFLFVNVLGLDHAALAGAFSITNNLEALLLLAWMRRRMGGLDPDGRLGRSVRRALLGAAAMGGALAAIGLASASRYPFLYYANQPYDGRGADVRLLFAWLAGVIMVAAGVYVGLAFAQGAEELTVWRERLLRRRGRSG